MRREVFATLCCLLAMIVFSCAQETEDGKSACVDEFTKWCQNMTNTTSVIRMPMTINDTFSYNSSEILCVWDMNAPSVNCSRNCNPLFSCSSRGPVLHDSQELYDSPTEDICKAKDIAVNGHSLDQQVLYQALVEYFRQRVEESLREDLLSDYNDMIRFLRISTGYVNYYYY